MRGVILIAAALLGACSDAERLEPGPDGGAADAPEPGDARPDPDGPRPDGAATPPDAALDATPAGDAAWGPDAAADAATPADATPVVDASTAADAATDAVTAVDAAPGDAAPGDAAPPPDPGPWVVHVAPDGDDARDGRTPETAVRTLERVHEILRAEEPDRDVEVRIAPGRYHGQQVRWRWTRPDVTIRFMPRDLDRGDRERPVFDGCLPDGRCPGGTWFRLRHDAGEATNLHFEYIRVENYQTAISLDGDRDAAETSNGHNRIYGCYFARIGNVSNPALDPSTAAVRLVNSDDNEIANNHFVDVINRDRGGLIHAIYVAHMSDRNVIARNRFLRSTGDPVRIRDFSNDNLIVDNRFIRVGTTAAYTDWYCDHDARDDCTKPDPECPSWGNQFRDNLLDGDWECDRLGVWHLFQDDETTGCAPPSPDARRVRTGGNQRTDRPCSMD